MRNRKTTKIAYMGLMLALAMVLSFLEHMIPPLPVLPPGVNLGLSNIVTMYCAFFLGKRRAFGIAALKSCFVALLRGVVAGCLSLCGGILSLLVIVLLLRLFGSRISYVAVSICGAVSHNLAQIAVASVLLSTGFVFYYFPVLMVSGIVMGAVTGVTLSVLLPVFHRVFGKLDREG